MSDTVRAAFRDQAQSCRALGSPFMGRLMDLLAERLRPDSRVGRRVLEWTGDVTAKGQSVPLRLAGALHGLRLEGLALADLYPPQDADDDTLHRGIEAAFEAHEARLMDWLDSPPQTNEVRRSSALLVGASLLAHRHGLPMVLSELGASAGLNLNFDRYAVGPYGAPDSSVRLRPELRGPQVPVAPIHVLDRAGVDLNPLDPQRDRQRLIAYLWPDQPERLTLTAAALDLGPPPIDRGDAADWLENRLVPTHPGALHLVFHTIAWQYFPADVQKRCLASLDAAGRKATPDAPLARLSYEADALGPGAALSLTTWPNGRTETLGRVDFHGRWLEFADPAPET